MIHLIFLLVQLSDLLGVQQVGLVETLTDVLNSLLEGHCINCVAEFDSQLVSQGLGESQHILHDLFQLGDAPVHFLEIRIVRGNDLLQTHLEEFLGLGQSGIKGSPVSLCLLLEITIDLFQGFLHGLYPTEISLHTNPVLLELKQNSCHLVMVVPVLSDQVIDALLESIEEIIILHLQLLALEPRNLLDIQYTIPHIGYLQLDLVVKHRHFMEDLFFQFIHIQAFIGFIKLLLFGRNQVDLGLEVEDFDV